MNATLFSAIFFSALALSLAAKTWLARRQLRCVSAHRSRVPEDFVDRISLAEHQKAADYTCAKTRLALFTDYGEAALALILTFGGVLEWLAKESAGLFSGPLLSGLALIGFTALILQIFEIPFDFYRSFVIEARFGFNKLTLPLFFKDLLKETTLALFLGAPLCALLLFLVMKSGGNWWLYAWVSWVAFNLFLLAIYPSFIAPIFNKFSPLPAGPLREGIEKLLARCGFSAEGLYVMDGSRRSSHGNAYFTGFGKTKRIVFFDTLLERLAFPEVEAVLAHELGHYKMRHVLKRMILVFLLSLGFLAALGYLIDCDWFYRGLGVETASPAAALVLFFLAIPAFTFLLKPLSSYYFRKNEFEADAYAAQNASAADLVHALVKLYQDNAATLTPDPLYSAFYDSHPPAALRIAHLQQI